MDATVKRNNELFWRHQEKKENKKKRYLNVRTLVNTLSPSTTPIAIPAQCQSSRNCAAYLSKLLVKGDVVTACRAGAAKVKFISADDAHSASAQRFSMRGAILMFLYCKRKKEDSKRKHDENVEVLNKGCMECCQGGAAHQIRMFHKNRGVTFDKKEKIEGKSRGLLNHFQEAL